MKKYVYGLGILMGICTGCVIHHSDRQAEIAKERITVEKLRQHTEVLSNDSCQGRKPFSQGAERAVEYIAEQMREVGLKPFQGNSYFQEVPLILSTTKPSPEMLVKTSGGNRILHRSDDFIAFTARIEPEIDIEDAELIFAGYGIVAPEYGKNDYAGIQDPQNKIAVVLINDPGLGGDDASYFKGDIMTYYGRWTYKFEEGARQGLKGVLIIHDTYGAGYPWSVPQNSAKAKLYIEDHQNYTCALTGWLHSDVAESLFKDCGLELEKLKQIAKTPDFLPFPLHSTLTVSLKNEFVRQTSPNVIGYIEGSGKTDESIVYLAHWDHLGYGAPVGGDSIINGATDNATAVAWLLETARCFNALKEKPRRNIVFLSPTCEETGFWGTKYYVDHPLFPVEKVAAVINLDVIPLWGENNDVTITGYGHSTLDESVAELAPRYGRYVMPDPDARNGMFYRSDHFPFVQKGIPAMFAKGWNDNRKHGKEWAKEKIKHYWTEIYHKPTDQTHPETDDYGGLLQEVKLFFDLGYNWANAKNYPQWKPESEFADILDR